MALINFGEVTCDWRDGKLFLITPQGQYELYPQQVEMLIDFLCQIEAEVQEALDPEKQ
ncbi:hypothetical protein EI42_02268 [Thermosporothrix hazakensis]|jgi:hypothetical protein|uniref:Uncharacterized protein n=2 Tax=Thermosporothrix TaxID=768650 RepID=A0A326UHI1_THEHA|nr:hypothetical protein [Thermosporothrix hazakensis]PZW31171.1 hypothetical protein EI42_02268 [Thermosporothrix hazakensis]BBH86609.1 hypothetical protein KTC_13600 [Thermosporothrix sp. COM3]GCE50918.1 hypothetical protein KTH_57870 [Thermosporothrix hazakensis]